jgi:hypothetical protein
MSAQAAARVGASSVARPARSVPATRPTPRLLLVRAPAQTRTRVPFVVACMAILAMALLAALLLNTTMARGAYEQRDLDLELARLASSQQDLSAALDQRASPAELAVAARALGMVQARSTGWLQLADGTVQGGPAVGAGG